MVRIRRVGIIDLRIFFNFFQNSTELIINISDYDNVSSNDLIDDLKAIIRVVPAQTYFKATPNIISMKNHAR